MKCVHLSVLMIRCICGLLKNKCRILVTHQLRHLREVDQILVLKEVCTLAKENCLKEACLLLLNHAIAINKAFPQQNPA